MTGAGFGSARPARFAFVVVILAASVLVASGGGGHAHGGGAKEVKFVAKEIDHAALNETKVQLTLDKLVSECSTAWRTQLAEGHDDHGHDDHAGEEGEAGHEDHAGHAEAGGAAKNATHTEDEDDHDHGHAEGSSAETNGTASAKNGTHSHEHDVDDEHHGHVEGSHAETNGTATNSTSTEEHHGHEEGEEEGEHHDEHEGEEEASTRGRRLQQAIALPTSKAGASGRRMLQQAITPPAREPIHELLVGCAGGQLMCDVGQDASGLPFMSPVSCQCMQEEDECAASSAGTENYDRPLHIAAVFILLAVSVAGSGYPVLAYYKPRLALPQLLMRALAVFGAGVILTTALIHMIPPGFELLKSPCISATWSEYESFGGLFVLIGVLFIQAIELVVGRFMPHAHLGNHKHESMAGPGAEGHSPDSSDPGCNHDHHTPRPQLGKGDFVKPDLENACTDVTVQVGKPVVQQAAVIVPSDTSLAPAKSQKRRKLLGFIPLPQGPAVQSLAMTEEERRRRVGLVSLEVAIAAHSVIIGIMLGIARENFNTLLIAVSIHQFFEGIALSAAVLGAGIVRGWALPLLTMIPYGLATPLGVAIGIGIHDTYNATSTTRVLVEGIIECIAGGILIHAALVELITPAFEKAQKERARIVFFLVVSLWLGAAVMAILGRWA
eukprot:tig00021013_g17066.t1